MVLASGRSARICSRQPGCWLPLLLPDGAEEQVVCDRVAAVELADAGGLVEVGPQALGSSPLRPAVTADRVHPRGPNSSKAKTRSGCWSSTASMRSSFSSRRGSLVSFQVLVRWKVTSFLAKSTRRRSRPIMTRRVPLPAR